MEDVKQKPRIPIVPENIWLENYLRQRDEFVAPMESVTKAWSMVEQAVQMAVDKSSLNQSLSQVLHPPSPSGSWPSSHTVSTS